MIGRNAPAMVDADSDHCCHNSLTVGFQARLGIIYVQGADGLSMKSERKIDSWCSVGRALETSAQKQGSAPAACLPLRTYMYEAANGDPVDFPANSPGYITTVTQLHKCMKL